MPMGGVGRRVAWNGALLSKEWVPLKLFVLPAGGTAVCQSCESHAAVGNTVERCKYCWVFVFYNILVTLFLSILYFLFC